ncbi:Type 1 glutamine amidotransferase (GATase1) [Flavobacteriaceae bacterium MAR_2010_188]|nr:Type 1 glutamine amidotransferase (GATase1) [Flavobacteriaceae bacterium MAR_2010_188]
MYSKQLFIKILIISLAISCAEKEKKVEVVEKDKKLRALIIDGQNNHYIWPKTTLMMKDYLEDTDLFEVDVRRTDSVWLGVKYNQSRPEAYNYFIDTFILDTVNRGRSNQPIKSSNFKIDFSNYDVIVSNLGMGATEWPEETRKAFEKYVSNGGGLVTVHAADNSFPKWTEYNKMIALGGWGERDSISGPYVYYNSEGEVEYDYTQGPGGSHGLESEFVITTREQSHPVMNGLPEKWLHTQDELYERLRGPFENATILATAFSDEEGNAPPWDPNQKGMGQNVPMIMAIDYGKGRVFHTTLGHFDYSMECAGFITILQRGAEWASTGEVTQAVPNDFPTESKTSSRSWDYKMEE